MKCTSIDRLIINSPYEQPQRYWRYNREHRTFTLVEGERRPAGYVIASEGSKSFDDPGMFVEIPLVNQIRPRVKARQIAGYPGNHRWRRSPRSANQARGTAPRRYGKPHEWPCRCPYGNPQWS